MELERKKGQCKIFLIDFCGYQSNKKQSYLTSTLADLCLKDNNMINNNKSHHLTT